MIRPKCLSLPIATLAIFSSTEVALGQVRPLERGFEIAGPRLVATIIDGAVVALAARNPDDRHSSGVGLPVDVPAGIGHGGVARREAREIHVPGNRWAPTPRTSGGSLLRAFRVPSQRGGYSLKLTASGAEATWTGLTDGMAEHAQDEVMIRADVTASGSIEISGRVRSKDRGVFGAVIPFTGILRDRRFVVPSFGGMRYDQTELPTAISLSGGAPYLEAAAVAIEGTHGSVGIWSEDRTFPPTAVFLACGRDAMSLCIERLAPMPCDGNTELELPKLIVDACAGNWMSAMEPYRQWYAREFAAELAIRRRPDWAGGIATIVDQFDASDRGLRALSRALDPERTLLHSWEARKPRFDEDLPDWTPREGFGEFVLRAQQRGFRTMAYVNTYCVNAESKKVVKDRIPDFAITRKWMGLHQWGDPPAEWATAMPGKLLYLDPLAPGWRDYHAREMTNWNRVTRCDANYEDVGSIAGDGGNGTIDGLAGAQGGTAMFRLLLERNPSVPLASEHVADNMAFASTWPMRYPQKWGTHEQCVQWMRTQLPVCTFLFGSDARPWIPTIAAESEESRVMVVACSDALGGVAQVPARAGDAEARNGIVAHMYERARLWCQRGIAPDLRPGLLSDSATCRYRDREGRRYSYQATGKVHEFREDGRGLLYQRVTGVSAFTSQLRVSGWPAHDDHGPIGLNPSLWYVLEPDAGERTSVEVTKLPTSSFVSTWAEEGAFALLEVSPMPGTPASMEEIVVRTERRVATVTLNDRTAEPPVRGGTSYRISLPARFVFGFESVESAATDGSPVPSQPTGRFSGVSSGIDRGCSYEPSARMIATVKGFSGPVVLSRHDGGGDSEVARDYFFRVPSSDASAVVIVHCGQREVGNGAVVRALVNGAEVRRVDFRPVKGRSDVGGSKLSESWTIPLGDHVGQPVLLTIATNGKGDDNSDQIWTSVPCLISSPEQRAIGEQVSVDAAR